MPPNPAAFALFAVDTSVTPGPNNIMAASFAAHSGMWATVPAMLGISLGFGAMVVLGVAGPLAAHPALHGVLRWVGGAWLLWIAWAIAHAGPVALPAGSDRAAPMGFTAAVPFQWVDPKARVLAVATTTTYASPGNGFAGQILAFAALSIPCTLPWSLLGAGARRILRPPVQLRAFNAVMAAPLILSIFPSLVAR